MTGDFTDLHTHILPAVDDGAADLDASLNLLRWQKEHGIARVALTSHFYPSRESLEDFLQRRQSAYSMLMSAWDPATMPEVKLGAEVHYSPNLSQVDLRSLTIGNSDYLLLELPGGGVPAHFEEVVHILLMQGIIPILAHIERCGYLRQDPTRLLNLVHMGVLAQLSTSAFEIRAHRKFANICLEKGLAHILASDIHRLEGLDTAVSALEKKLSPEEMGRAEEFAKAVWDNEAPPPFSILPIRKGFFGYY